MVFVGWFCIFSGEGSILILGKLKGLYNVFGESKN